MFLAITIVLVFLLGWTAKEKHEEKKYQKIVENSELVTDEEVNSILKSIYEKEKQDGQMQMREACNKENTKGSIDYKTL